MSRDTRIQSAALDAMQRLGSALQDMIEELPEQKTRAAEGGAEVLAILAAIEKQLRWLAEDMARTRAALVDQEQSNDRLN